MASTLLIKGVQALGSALLEGEKMKQSTHTNSRYLLSLLVGALMLSGCGARTTGADGNSEQASRTVIKSAANCNIFSAANTQLSGKLQVYVNPLGSVVSDLMRMKITGINSNFSSNPKYALQMFKWKAYSSNGTFIEPNPVTFSVWYNGRQISNYLTQLTITDINNLKQQNFITANNATEFFQKTEILVNDVDLSWDALKVVLYEHTTSGPSNVIGDVDTLMPAFSADPNDYSTDHPAVLNQLHPFWYDRNDNMDFAAAANSFCF